MCDSVFNVRPKTTHLLPVWRRDANRWDPCSINTLSLLSFGATWKQTRGQLCDRPPWDLQAQGVCAVRTLTPAFVPGTSFPCWPWISPAFLGPLSLLCGPPHLTMQQTIQSLHEFSHYCFSLRSAAGSIGFTSFPSHWWVFVTHPKLRRHLVTNVEVFFCFGGC